MTSNPNAKHVAMIENTLFSLFCPHHSQKVVKVNQYPKAERFFLCVDCIVELAEFNKKYGPYYLPLVDFAVKLTGGKQSTGDDMTEKLKNRCDCLKEVKSGFEQRIEIEDTIIDGDMDQLKEMVIEKIEEFFEEQKTDIKRKLREENAELKNTLFETEKLLAMEIKNVVNNADIFDLSNFAVQFDSNKNNVLDQQNFLQDYLTVQENDEKTIAGNYLGESNKFYYLLDEGYNIDNYFTPYQQNVEKFKYHHKPIGGDMSSVLEKFCKSVVNILECKFMRARHLSKEDNGAYNSVITEEQSVLESSTYNSKPKSPEKNVSRTQMSTQQFYVPEKNTMKKKKSSIVKKPSQNTNSRWKLDALSYNNAKDLYYDCDKFSNMHINKLNLIFKSSTLNLSVAENILHLLTNLGSVKQLVLDLSATKIDEKIAKSLSRAQSLVNGLTSLKFTQNRCKFDDGACERIIRSLCGQKLSNISLGMEKVRMTKPLIDSMIEFFRSQTEIEELDLNFNYTSLSEYEIDTLFESLNSHTFHSFALSLRSSGLDNSAMLALASVLSINLQIHSRLNQDLSYNLIFDSEAKELGLAQKNFFDLQQLILGLEGCELGDEGFIHLAEAVLSLENQETLKLNCVKNGLSTQYIVSIMNQLNFLDHLSTFELYARNNCWITNREREQISEASQQMKNLVVKKIEF